MFLSPWRPGIETGTAIPHPERARFHLISEAERGSGLVSAWMGEAFPGAFDVHPAVVAHISGSFSAHSERSWEACSGAALGKGPLFKVKCTACCVSSEPRE